MSLTRCANWNACSVVFIHRVAQNLAIDQIVTAFPEVDEPFKNKRDVVDRLLPYHIYQHPRRDLDELRDLKGKGKATELDTLKEEIKGTITLLIIWCNFWLLLEACRRNKFLAGHILLLSLLIDIRSYPYFQRQNSQLNVMSDSQRSKRV